MRGNSAEIHSLASAHGECSALPLPPPGQADLTEAGEVERRSRFDAPFYEERWPYTTASPTDTVGLSGFGLSEFFFHPLEGWHTSAVVLPRDSGVISGIGVPTRIYATIYPRRRSSSPT